MGQNIVIKPNKDGVAEQPKIDFVGANAGASGITLKVLGDSGLSFEGTSGQLFSINNNLSTGKIFSVNDISGIPSIDVDADGTVRLNPFNGTVFSNTLKAYGPISGTGAGNSLTLTAGSGVTSGAGGNLILQAGLQAATGGDGRILIQNVIEQGSATTAVWFRNTIAQAVTEATSLTNAKFRWDMDRSGVTQSIYMSRGKLNLPAIGGVPTLTIGGSYDNQPESSGYQNSGLGNVIGGGGIGLFASHSPMLWGFQNMTGITHCLGFSSNGGTNTSLDNGFSRATVGVICVSSSLISNGTVSGGGSFAFPSATTAIAANTNDLVLTGSAFQRLNCTAPSSLTGIAPPSGGTHVDGRMIRVYNVGTANLTLTHNSGLSTAANRFWNSTAADIVLAPNDYAELIYDSTSNGSGISGWRVS